MKGSCSASLSSTASSWRASSASWRCCTHMCSQVWCRLFRRSKAARLLFAAGTLVPLLLSVAAHAQPARRPEPLLPADRLVAWLEDVQRHTPGAVDGAALEVANWSRSDLEILAGDIRKVSAFYDRFRQDRGRRLRIYDRT